MAIGQLLLTLLALTATVCSDRSFIEFQIRKRHTNGDKSTRVGKLTINIHEIGSIQSYVDSQLQEIVALQDFEGGHQAILEFICVDTDIPQYKGRLYLTSVDQIVTEPHGQKIAIVLGPTTDLISINSINYVQTRERAGESYTQILDTKHSLDTTFSYQQEKAKAAGEDETFFSKYKWPLIIGGVLVYTMMTASPQAAAGAGAGAGAAQ